MTADAWMTRGQHSLGWLPITRPQLSQIQCQLSVFGCPLVVLVHTWTTFTGASLPVTRGTNQYRLSFTYGGDRYVSVVLEVFLQIRVGGTLSFPLDTCRWYFKFASQKNLKVSQLWFLLPITSGASSICSHSDNFYFSIPVQPKTLAIAKTLKPTWRVSIP